MTQTTALVTVVSGDAYHRFADDMFESAREFFAPTLNVELVKLESQPGWPAATMMRYHILSASLPRAHFVYLIDADMRFEANVGPEILPPGGLGITATLHPGYVGKPPRELPFERRFESAAFVSGTEGLTYFCGGFIGGERLAVRLLASKVSAIIDADLARGTHPQWHDESAINRVLAHEPPTRILDPSYCFPDRSDYYERTVWPIGYERKIVAIDKDAATRGDR